MLKPLNTRTQTILNRDENTQRYFNNIKKYQVLKQEEEFELFQRGDEESLDKIIKSNLKFVVSCAKEYQKTKNVELMDLISAGNHGLMIALKKFDHTKGFKFISYAVWYIRQGMQKYISENSFIRIPKHIETSENKKIKDFLKDGIEPDFEKSKKINNKILSLDSKIKIGEDYTLIDIIENKDVDEFPIFIDDISYDVQIALNQLNELDRMMLIMRFGLDGSEPKSFDFISEKLGLKTTRWGTSLRFKKAQMRFGKKLLEVREELKKKKF